MVVSVLFVMQEINDVLISMICLRQLAVLAYVRGKEVRRARARAREREREREEREKRMKRERDYSELPQTGGSGCRSAHRLRITILITFAYLPMHSSLSSSPQYVRAH